MTCDGSCKTYKDVIRNDSDIGGRGVGLRLQVTQPFD